MSEGTNVHGRRCVTKERRSVRRYASGARVSDMGLDEVPEVCQNQGEGLSGTKL